MSILALKSDLHALADQKRAEILMRFFKTGPGQYGDGDQFLGIQVPEQRKIARKFRDLQLTEIKQLIKSPIHEERLTALFILVDQFERADKIFQKKICEFYLENRTGVNNWDLVDLSAPKILGAWLAEKNFAQNPKALKIKTTSKTTPHTVENLAPNSAPSSDRTILYQLVGSKNLWDRRIAILATYTFIKNKDFTDALALSEMLLTDTHDLIHKAVGWMLREIGKQDQATLEKFLTKHTSKMPRTMLRYAIEKFPQKKRLIYLKKSSSKAAKSNAAYFRKP